MKQQLGRYLWSLVQYADDCDEKPQLLTNYVKIGLETIRPLKKSRVHVNDPPLKKKLIKQRQHASNTGDIKHYSNMVNRRRKVLRASYYAAKVKYLKDTKPSQ